MFNNRLLRVALILAGGAVFFNPGNAAARQTVVLGSIGVGYDYWERTYDNEVDDGLGIVQYEGDRREYYVWPGIELQSLGIHDTLSLRYAPVLRYDDLLDETNLDHYLTLSGERSLNKDWTVELSDRFAYTDDPGRYGTTFYSEGIGGPGEDSGVPPQVEPPPDEITQNLGRRRYWTNDLNLNTTYTYAEDSDAGLGYAYRVLRNDSNDDLLAVGYDEYDRHQFSGLWSYRFNPFWRTQFDLNYVKGLYQDRLDIEIPEAPPLSLSQDLQEYWADVQLDYSKGVSDTLPLQYKFRGAQYEDLRQDIWVHELTAGWNHVIDSRTRLGVGAGPSYVNAKDLDGELGYNAYLNLTRTYQRGDISAVAKKGYDLRNFTGANDSGLIDLVDVSLNLTHRFRQDLTSTFFVQYRNEDIINPQGAYYLAALGGREPLSGDNVGDVTYSRDSYSAGASLDYTFQRWFVATVRYVYYQQDGDLIRDSYTDHRVTLLLSFNKEIFRK